MSLAVILLSALCVLLAGACAWLGIRLAEQNGRILLRLDALEAKVKGSPPASTSSPSVNQFGVPAGTQLNDFRLPALSGGSMSLLEWKGRMVALIFFDPGCHHCRALLPELAGELKHITDDGPQPLILTTGSEEANRKIFEEHPITCPVLLQTNSEVARMASVGATPLALLVGPDGKTAGNALLGGEQIMTIFRAAAVKNGSRASEAASRLAKSKIERNGLKAGTVAPAFRLPTLNGGEISLADYRGNSVLLVFSDPECTPCNQLAPKLDRAYRQSKETQILMISRGDAEANRAKVREFGLTYPVVLQRQWEVSKDYAMFATPIGYLVDESGLLAADVAVGVDSILELASQQRGIGAQSGR